MELPSRGDGPSALLATCCEGTGQAECAYKGYKTMCFTDKTDAFTSSIGYLPGPMPWKVQEALEAKGVEVLNKSETGAVTVDRELITGAAPTRPTTSASWRPRLPGAPLPLAYLAIPAALPRYLPPKNFFCWR